MAASQTESAALSREFAQLRAHLDLMSLRMGPRLAKRLEVVARATTAGTEIRINDSGPGLPGKHEHEPSARPFGTSDGLQHVRGRLRAVYGPAARLSLERRHPTGVCAMVLIPT